MFDCEEEFSHEQLEKIKGIIKTSVFREINSITNICELNQTEDKIIKNVKDYIYTYISNRSSSSFPLDVDCFISFIENYPIAKKPRFTLPSEDGKVRKLKEDSLIVSNGYHIFGDNRYLGRHGVEGIYMCGSYLGSDHKIYLSKRSMRSRSLPVSREIVQEVDYNSLLAESVFRFFNVPVASYYLLSTNSSPFKVILTPNFLEKNQELVHLKDCYENESFFDTHTNRFNIIAQNLGLRYKDKMSDQEFQLLIEKLQLQYCIQSFFKQLIGPMDSNHYNTAIILTHNGTSVPSIDFSPAFDLDISFNISCELENNNQLGLISNVNQGPSTITSLIKEFKNIKGFKEFLDDFIKKISGHDVSNELLDDVYKRTNLDFFIERKDSYKKFLIMRFLEVFKAYKEVFLMEEGYETNMGRS